MNNVDNERIEHLVSVSDLILSKLTELAKINEMPMTTQQAAYYLNCTPRTIYKYKQQGLLKEATNGKMSGYLASDLDKLKKL